MRDGGRHDVVEARGDDGDTDLVAEGVVDDVAEDDVRLGVRRLPDQLRGVVDLAQSEVGAALEEHEHAVGAVDGGLQQRRGDRGLDRPGGAVLAGGSADAHERRSRILYHRLHVVEVHVDQAGSGDEFRDALNAREEHLVCRAEGVEHGDVGVGDLQKTIIRDDNERVDFLAQGRHPSLGLSRAAVALEGEGTGDNADGQRTGLAGDLGHDRSRTRARAAAFTRGHKDHVGTLERRSDLVDVILRCLTTNGGISASAEAVGQLATDIELRLGIGHEQGLGVGVDRDELNTFEADLDHSVHGVHAAAANANDLDHCQVVLRCRHGCLPCIKPSTFS